MLTSDLLIFRPVGGTIVPKPLSINSIGIYLATEQINCFCDAVGSTQGQLDKKLLDLQGDSPDCQVIPISFKIATLRLGKATGNRQ